MPTRPSLVRSIPFWGLIVVSLATAAGGWYVLSGTLENMTTTLTDGTATGVDVYVGQSLASLGAVLIGAGVIGILLAIGIAAVSTLRPRVAALPAAPVTEAVATDDTAAERAEAVDAAGEPALSR